MEFEERLKAARKARKLTQKEVADALNVTTSTYCGYETGKRKPDVFKIKKLAEILGVPADVLLGTEQLMDKEEPPDYVPKTPEARTLAVGLDRMTPEQRERAMKLVQLMFDQADIWEDSNDGTKT